MSDQPERVYSPRAALALFVGIILGFWLLAEIAIRIARHWGHA